ncbi:MAG: hypothetical protein AAGG50_17335 [Bacteroidota bacterium]
MSEFWGAYDIFMSIATGVATAVSIKIFTDQIRSKKIAYSFATLMAISGLIVVNLLLRSVFESSTSVRKIILGNEYIEGYWFDTTSRDTVLEHGAVVTIEEDRGEYKLYGQSFLRNGKKLGTFNSTSSAYFDKNLMFKYESYSLGNQYNGVEFLKFNADSRS